MSAIEQALSAVVALQNTVYDDAPGEDDSPQREQWLEEMDSEEYGSRQGAENAYAAVVEVLQKLIDKEREEIFSAVDSDCPYRINVMGDVAYARDLDAALVAAQTLVEDQQEDEDEARATIVVEHLGQRSVFATAIARRGCRSQREFEVQEIVALGSLRA